MNVLITGANGQLGRSFKNAASDFPEWSFDFADIEKLDITKRDELEKYLKEKSFDYVINCAAYTAVDKAEEEIAQAALINETAVANLAACSNKLRFTLIHISTDYVFNGHHFRPYTEEDLPDPQSVYSKSKHAGEQAVMNHCQNGIVLRTSWLYSEFGTNFLKTILRLASEREALNVIYDQIGTPTYAGDLANAALEIIRNRFTEKSIFHFSNQGVASWYDFAQEIIRLTGKKCTVRPILTEEYPLPAKRPFYSLMSKKKFSETFSYEIPHWKDSLVLCLKNMDELV